MMKFAKITTSALILLGALVLAEAGYNSNNNYESADSRHSNNAYNAPACSGYECNNGNGNGYANNDASHYSQHNSQLLHADCRGYACTKNIQSTGHYGPYHSYPVRPAIYGGHGLYSYRGYTRHAPAAHYRPTRSCSGYNCGHQRRPNNRYHPRMNQYRSRPSYPLASPMAIYGGRQHQQYNQSPRYNSHNQAARHHGKNNQNNAYEASANYNGGYGEHQTRHYEQNNYSNNHNNGYGANMNNNHADNYNSQNDGYGNNGHGNNGYGNNAANIAQGYQNRHHGGYNQKSERYNYRANSY